MNESICAKRRLALKMSVLEVALEVGVSTGRRGGERLRHRCHVRVRLLCADDGLGELRESVLEHAKHLRPDAHVPRAPAPDARDERAQLSALRRAQLVPVEVHEAQQRLVPQHWENASLAATSTMQKQKHIKQIL